MTASSKPVPPQLDTIVFGRNTLLYAVLTLLALPRALPPDPNHHGSVVFIVLSMLAGAVFFGGMTGCAHSWSFWGFTSLFMRRSLKVVGKAAMVMASAFCTSECAWCCVLLVPGGTGEILEACLMVANWIAALTIAIRILWRGERPSRAAREMA